MKYSPLHVRRIFPSSTRDLLSSHKPKVSAIATDLSCVLKVSYVLKYLRLKVARKVENIF